MHSPPPAFSDVEYQRRRSSVRALMEGSGVDCLLVHSFPNICYLTGFETIAYHKYFCLLLPLRGTPVLIAQLFEAHNAALGAFDLECAPFGFDADVSAATREALCSHSWGQSALGVELSTPALSPEMIHCLRESLPDAGWRDASGWVESIRIVQVHRRTQGDERSSPMD